MRRCFTLEAAPRPDQSKTSHPAADVCPAGHEVLAAAEQDLHGMPNQAEAILNSGGRWRPAIRLLGAAHPAEDGVVVGAHQLEPVVDAGPDGLFADLLYRETGRLQRSHVEV